MTTNDMLLRNVNQITQRIAHHAMMIQGRFNPARVQAIEDSVRDAKRIRDDLAALGELLDEASVNCPEPLDDPPAHASSANHHDSTLHLVGGDA